MGWSRSYFTTWTGLDVWGAHEAPTCVAPSSTAIPEFAICTRPQASRPVDIRILSYRATGTLPRWSWVTKALRRPAGISTAGEGSRATTSAVELGQAMDSSEIISSVMRDVEDHAGMAALRSFGARLKQQPMSQAQLTVFLASTAEFFKEVPAGILALGLRVTDDWMALDRFGAVTRGAMVLYSAVDEFGLHQLQRGVQASHHSLFREMAAGFGVAENDLLNPAHILPEATKMAEATRAYYRSKSVAAGLGFHLASEISSDIEFNLCLDGLRAFPADYGLDGDDDPKLRFYLIHTEVEPMHGSTSKEAVAACLLRDPASAPDIRDGALAFMEPYGRLFDALQRICGDAAKNLECVA